jgi:hypothetical protein
MARTVCLPWNGQHWPGWMRDGLPTFGYRDAPPDLATPRQLRAKGLCPGGHGPVAQIVWRRGRRWAALYRLDLAKPSPGATVAQLAALYRAHLTLRTCQGQCRQIFPYRLPRSTERRCGACATAEQAASPERTPAWR